MGRGNRVALRLAPPPDDKVAMGSISDGAGIENWILATGYNGYQEMVLENQFPVNVSVTS